MPQRKKKPTPEQIGKALRGAFKNIGKLAQGEDVITEAVQPEKKKKKREVAAKPPTPKITAGLLRHRKSIKDRELRPSVAGLQRAQ
ncbi:hypothetical protein LCGC14_1258560 [marine sediment metagenome]|uniref:Uncharacterized protein n=1 Tax=marine sediment metagenome TaxID=412755 RepID=A0A0F9LMQ7_9ZZZZ